MTRPKVLHLVNSAGFTPGPSGRASWIDDTQFEVIICSYYGGDESGPMYRQGHAKEVISLDARSRVDLRAWVRLYRLLRNRRIHILHTHHNVSGILGRLLGKIAAVPIVINSTGTMHSRFPLWLRVIKAFSMMPVDASIFVSRGVEKSFSWWENVLCRRARKCIVYNGVDVSAVDEACTRRTEKRRELGFAQDAFVVGHIGRLIEIKDQRTVLRAFSEVAARCDQARLVIVGSGEMEDELKACSLEWGIADKVLFTGQISLTSTYEILCDVDVFVICSVAEGFSKVVLEAMAARKPVVATDIPPFREAVVDGVTGRIVPIHDHVAVADAILQLEANAEEAHAMGRAGRERVEDKFQIRATSVEYERIYRELLVEKGLCSE